MLGIFTRHSIHPSTGNHVLLDRHPLLIGCTSNILYGRTNGILSSTRSSFHCGFEHRLSCTIFPSSRTSRAHKPDCNGIVSFYDDDPCSCSYSVIPDEQPCYPQCWIPKSAAISRRSSPFKHIAPSASLPYFPKPSNFLALQQAKDADVLYRLEHYDTNPTLHLKGTCIGTGR